MLEVIQLSWSFLSNINREENKKNFIDFFSFNCYNLAILAPFSVGQFVMLRLCSFVSIAKLRSPLSKFFCPDTWEIL